MFLAARLSPPVWSCNWSLWWHRADHAGETPKQRHSGKPAAERKQKRAGWYRPCPLYRARSCNRPLDRARIGQFCRSCKGYACVWPVICGGLPGGGAVGSGKNQGCSTRSTRAEKAGGARDANAPPSALRCPREQPHRRQPRHPTAPPHPAPRPGVGFGGSARSPSASSLP